MENLHEIPKNAEACADLCMAFEKETGKELGGFLEEMFALFKQALVYTEKSEWERWFAYDEKYKILNQFLHRVQP